MKRPTLTDRSGSSKANVDEQISKALTDALNSDDKTIEIRPANRSSGPGILRLLLVVGVAIGLSYWLRESQRPTEMIQSVTRESADRTKGVTDKAAETIQEGGKTVAERVEKESERAGETVEETGESAAETTEEAGEKAAESADESDIGSSGS